ncbi:ACT domain-containing protein [Candidatus Woesearchaeota archaeon]|nr:ACT domain-containing protein [Candidatus Woesearchaeota archaeon]
MNITKAVAQYIQEHPSIMDSLKKGLINYSALSRKIGKEMGIRKFDAVLIACRRHAAKLKAQKAFEKDIMDLLKKSKFEVKSSVVAAVLEPDIYFDSLIELQKAIRKRGNGLHVVQGSNSITIITADDMLPMIKEYFRNKIIKINQHLAEITLTSSAKLEDTPGVMSYLYGLFAEHGINIVETMSCYTDTIFLIDQDDVAKALQAVQR